MKFVFTSDKFSLIHPTLQPRPSHNYSKNELKEAEINTKNIKFIPDLLSEARDDSYNELPANQMGSIIVFPEVSEENTPIMIDFIKNAFASVQNKLENEYCDRLDPTSFFRITSDGSVFDASFINSFKKLNEKFTNKSICIYVAGCKSDTANYLFEEFVESAAKESDRHDKVENKHFNTIEGYQKCIIGFSSFHSFLVYSFENKKFHQLGFKENELYYSPTRKKTPGEYDAVEYSISIGNTVD